MKQTCHANKNNAIFSCPLKIVRPTAEATFSIHNPYCFKISH